jgi:hypothetical protein
LNESEFEKHAAVAQFMSGQLYDLGTAIITAKTWIGDLLVQGNDDISIVQVAEATVIKTIDSSADVTARYRSYTGFVPRWLDFQFRRIEEVMDTGPGRGLLSDVDTVMFLPEGQKIAVQGLRKPLIGSRPDTSIQGYPSSFWFAQLCGTLTARGSGVKSTDS